MEILSTGEKIKRARIYKGITLKELCGDIISISKMSCIENGKIKADNECLKYIAEKLKVNYEYLTQDIYEQLTEILKSIDSNKFNKIEKEELVISSLEYAKENLFYELAFEFIHLLFITYIDKNEIDKCQALLFQYSDIYKQCRGEKYELTYQEDMAKFFTIIKEYSEGASYFSRVRILLKSNEKLDKERYIVASFNEGLCYRKLGQIEKSFEVLQDGIKYIDSLNGKIPKGGYYNQMALSAIVLNKPNTEEYIKKAMENLKDNPVEIARSKGKIAECYFKIGNNELAIKEMKSAIEMFPKEEELLYAKFIIDCVEILYSNNLYEELLQIIEDALNVAIKVDDIKLIEKAYYYKGMVFQKQDSIYSAEIYMNLSTDALSRFGSREQLYKRYREMGVLYHKLGETKQSTDYFILAFTLDKIM